MTWNKENDIIDIKWNDSNGIGEFILKFNIEVTLIWE